MRKALPTWLIASLGIAAIAAPCSTTGPMQRNFATGSLVIPMDNCYQRRDSSAPTQTNGCTTSLAADDGVFRAYGLVYFLLKHDVTVYWAIDGATPKAAVTGLDVTVAPGPSPLVKKLNWGTFAFDPISGFDSAQGLAYLGGPFIIDARVKPGGAPTDKEVALALIKNDPDFARFRGASDQSIDIHEVESEFSALQVRPLTGPPPKVAILAVDPQPYHKTSLDVMYKYAVAAGLDDPDCTPANGDCAGGLGASCDAAFIQKYLADTLCARVSGNCPSANVCASCAPDWVGPNILTAKFNPPGVPGKIFDILCDGDFIPPQGGTYADTQLAQGGYKLLWIPHWDTGKITPTEPASRSAAAPAPYAPSPPNSSTANRSLREWQLSWQLENIAAYVNAGNNLFVECLGIGALESGAGMHGLPATLFQTTGGMTDTTTSGNDNFALGPADFHFPAEPNIQIGDFALPGSDVDGAITTFHPDNAPSLPVSIYRSPVERLIYGTATASQQGSTCNPACTGGKVCWAGYVDGLSSGYRCVEPTPWDVATTAAVRTPDGVERGHVAYLGGHDYSPDVNNAAGTTGQTAGTRIVLNTLFNLGFACSDPNTPCSTGMLGACAQGTLRCASGGGLTCQPPAGFPTAQDACDGNDSNCNGVIDDGCNQTECTPGATRSCYGGLTGTADVGLCRSGTQTCSGGFWGACAGQVLPAPEACNGKDDDCNGATDDGDLCGSGRVCTSGVCLPSNCNSENARCPVGFDCDGSSQCQPIGCAGASPPGATCAGPEVCKDGLCVDPCSGVSCGSGSACSEGRCVAGGCALTGCSGGQACVEGSCVADPCAGVSCPTGTFCRLGDCVRSCSYVECAPGQSCDGDGFCQPTCSPDCQSGQVCVSGTCAADPCAGVQCGVSQVCHQGSCIDDPCLHVACPAGAGSCASGQCVGAGITTSVTTNVPAAAKSGGCGSMGTGGLLSLGGLLALLRRRRNAGGERRRAATPLSGVAAAAVALVFAGTLGGCSKSGGSTSCTAGQTACGSACVELTSSLDHCGMCGRACVQDFQCSSGACVLPTPNPLLRSVAPAVLGVGSRTALSVAGEGLATGAKLRVSGPGWSKELGLAVDAGGASATSDDVLDLSGIATGTADVRVANPGQPVPDVGRFISNAIRVSITDETVLRGVAPGLVRQDQPATVLTLTGVGFAPDASVTLTSQGGSPQALTISYLNLGTLTVSVEPGSLAVGMYDLTLTNPGGAPTSVKFNVTEGTPTFTSMAPGCQAPDTSLSGSATGAFVYPSSVVRVSGGSIVDSPLDTRCQQDGTDALGQCKDGQLRVTADLTDIPPGYYDVTIVNPGSPLPLRSGSLSFQVGVSCP